MVSSGTTAPLWDSWSFGRQNTVIKRVTSDSQDALLSNNIGRSCQDGVQTKDSQDLMPNKRWRNDITNHDSKQETIFPESLYNHRVSVGGHVSIASCQLSADMSLAEETDGAAELVWVDRLRLSRWSVGKWIKADCHLADRAGIHQSF